MFPSAGGECARMVYRRDGHVIDAGEAARVFGSSPMRPRTDGYLQSDVTPVRRRAAASFASVWPALCEKSALPPVAPLVPIDIAAVLAEDQGVLIPTVQRDALRIGVFRDLPYPVTMENSGEWAVDALDNRYGFFHVASPGAVGIRLAFDVRCNCPPGRELRIVGEPPVVIPVPALSSGAEAPFWAPACPGTTLPLWPPDADTADVRISAGRLAHIYLDPLAGGKLDAGACNLDVACEPEWASLATAVGGLGTISTWRGALLHLHPYHRRQPLRRHPLCAHGQPLRPGQTARAARRCWSFTGCTRTPPATVPIRGCSPCRAQPEGRTISRAPAARVKPAGVRISPCCGCARSRPLSWPGPDGPPLFPPLPRRSPASTIPGGLQAHQPRDAVQSGQPLFGMVP